MTAPSGRSSAKPCNVQSNRETIVASAPFARNLAAGAGAGAVTGSGNTERTQLATAFDTEADLVRGLHETIGRLATGPETRAVSSASDPIFEASQTVAGQGVVRSDPRQQFLRASSTSAARWSNSAANWPPPSAGQ
jgi:hypothetical protein